MKQFRLYIYALVAVLVSGFAASCSDSDEEPLLYSNYDFMEISGDSVISRKGLQMVASTVYTENDTSYVSTEVTVSSHVFDVDFAFRGKGNGDHALIKELSVISYREMLPDSINFAYQYYQLKSGTINWKDEHGEVLLDVDLKGSRFDMVGDSMVVRPYPQIKMVGKIRAIKNKTR